MIIDKLVLHDFGVYGGYQEITLTPASPQTPVVLFGGLNGAGKTTLLDALQLCLFGPIARCSNRNGKGYPEYLAGCINKHAQRKEALIGLDFRHTTNGKTDTYSIRRGWRKLGKGVSESFEVAVNGQSAETLTKSWLSHIDEIMPANIAHLFFFDGEKVEDYVVSERASALIETAVMNLLGLDIITQLDKDLRTLAQRRAIKELDTGKQAETAHIEKMVRDLSEEAGQLYRKAAWLRTHEISPRKRKLAELEEVFRKAGGGLHERRAEIEVRAKMSRDELAACEDALVSLAESDLPYALAQGLLVALDRRDAREHKVLRVEGTIKDVEAIKENLVRYLQQTGASEETLLAIERYMGRGIKGDRQALGGEVKNPIDEHTRRSLRLLIGGKVAHAEAGAKDLLDRHGVLAQELEDAEHEWASVPKDEDVRQILEEIKVTKDSLAACERELAEVESKRELLERQRGQHEGQLQSLLAEAVEKETKDEENTRILAHSAKARETLEAFKHRVIREHLRHIQSLVLENYQSLLRKEALVARITIDPDTFRVWLRDEDGRVVPIERLSAGERQLLAISILWGMGKASGRPLPTAIDTPLGRLDSSHREHLVCRYFPSASHQVLLFSTDQEIHGEHLAALKGRVSRCYRLEHNDRTGTTRIAEGYIQ